MKRAIFMMLFGCKFICSYTIIYRSTLKLIPNCRQINVLSVDNDRHANYLNCTFMNMNKNLKNVGLSCVCSAWSVTDVGLFFTVTVTLSKPILYSLKSDGYQL